MNTNKRPFVTHVSQHYQNVPKNDRADQSGTAGLAAKIQRIKTRSNERILERIILPDREGAARPTDPPVIKRYREYLYIAPSGARKTSNQQR